VAQISCLPAIKAVVGHMGHKSEAEMLNVPDPERINQMARSMLKAGVAIKMVQKALPISEYKARKILREIEDHADPGMAG